MAGYCCRLTTIHQASKSLAYEDLHYNTLLQSGTVH
jgi:hypothetical protein